ncbi:hypothetical protein TcCL_NonESM13724 [Trypanosoma cruzi]|nr:hypothetical protein TcCL_NonESM13724 [Trypanosoma cruzi]
MLSVLFSLSRLMRGAPSSQRTSKRPRHHHHHHLMRRSCSRAMQRTILPECNASLKTDKVSAKTPRGGSVIAAPAMAFAPLQDGVFSMRYTSQRVKSFLPSLVPQSFRK